jgi:hypothetical protein
MPKRAIALKGHRDECTEATCYCFDPNGDPMCDGCWQAGCFCKCEYDEDESQDREAVVGSERANVLREAAILVAQSKEAHTSECYAIARELWRLWWMEVGR